MEANLWLEVSQRLEWKGAEVKKSGGAEVKRSKGARVLAPLRIG